MKDLSMLTPLMRRGSEFLGVKYPIICGAMTWVSEPKLVSAVCNAGGFAAWPAATPRATSSKSRSTSSGSSRRTISR